MCEQSLKKWIKELATISLASEKVFQIQCQWTRVINEFFRWVKAAYLSQLAKRRTFSSKPTNTTHAKHFSMSRWSKNHCSGLCSTKVCRSCMRRVIHKQKLLSFQMKKIFFWFEVKYWVKISIDEFTKELYLLFVMNYVFLHKFSL